MGGRELSARLGRSNRNEVNGERLERSEPFMTLYIYIYPIWLAGRSVHPRVGFSAPSFSLLFRLLRAFDVLLARAFWPAAVQVAQVSAIELRSCQARTAHSAFPGGLRCPGFRCKLGLFSPAFSHALFGCVARWPACQVNAADLPSWRRELVKLTPRTCQADTASLPN